MSEFEYFRNLPFGQVVPGDSPVHRLDARARILTFGLVMAALLFSPSPIGLLIGLAAVLVGLRLAKLPLDYALRSLRAPLPFLLLLALLQVFFNALPDNGPLRWHFWIFTLTPLDLLAGAMLLLRFAALVLAISFSGQVLSTSDLAHGLDRLFAPLEKAGIPVHDGIMALVVTLRFLPFLAQTAERIAKAQASRGAQWTSAKGGLFRRVRAQLPLLVPIFITSLRRAEIMALAMDARGYASRANPTSLVEMHWSPRDSLALLVSFAITVMIAAL